MRGHERIVGILGYSMDIKFMPLWISVAFSMIKEIKGVTDISWCNIFDTKPNSESISRVLLELILKVVEGGRDALT